MKSIFGSEKELSEAQYLAEIMCKRMAEIKKTYLPPLFWKMDEWIDWKKKIHIENIAANKLLKLYSMKAILLALNDRRASYVQSYHNKTLPRLIQEYQRKLEAEQQSIDNKPAIEINTDIFTLPTKIPAQKNKLNKLRD